MNDIRIEITRDTDRNGVWIYTSMLTRVGIAEAERFAEALSFAIDVARKWQTGNRFDTSGDKPKDQSRVAGGKARADKLSPQRRREIARNASNTRWNKEAEKIIEQADAAGEV